MGAPAEVRGTAPAIDQGISGAITTTEFSRSIAKSFLSVLSLSQSFSVSMIARVWLQEIIEVITETRTVTAKPSVFPAYRYAEFKYVVACGLV